MGQKTEHPIDPLLLTTEEVAKKLSVSRRTLVGWRQSGEGPAYIRLNGRLIRYSVADIEAWISDQMVI
jgi:excisionase family DNA binding protein